MATKKLKFDPLFTGLQILWETYDEREWYSVDKLKNNKRIGTEAECYDGRKKSRYKYYPLVKKIGRETFELIYDEKANCESKDAIEGIHRIEFCGGKPIRMEWKNMDQKRPYLMKEGDDWVFNKNSQTDSDSNYAAQEGNKKLVSHYRRERDNHLIEEKKSSMHGNLKCEACEFNFSETYPEIGDDFCEAHHKLPLKTGRKTNTIDDLAILCSNCHRMIHRTARKKSEIMSVDEFRDKFFPR